MYNRALKLIREYHRLSRTEVAEKVGLSKSYVSELERGRKPTIEVIERYAETFRIPVSSLLLFAEYSENPNIPERARAFTADKVLKMLEWLRDTAGEDIDDDEKEKLPSERLKAAAT
jgi:transcriptional regulator with XRE-family HTH domain